MGQKEKAYLPQVTETVPLKAAVEGVPRLEPDDAIDDAISADLISPFIHIGYHKTASTWLQRHFFSRRDLGLCRIKMDMPFHNIHPLRFSAAAYKSHYHPKILQVENGDVPVFSLERLSGHPHSGGVDCKDIADRLKAVFPKARILMVIRQQNEAILSSWYQYVKKGGTGSLKNYLLPRTDGHVPLFHRDHFCYDALIEYYQKLFGASRVKVLPYEWFRDEPSKFLTEIVKFGGFEMPESLPIRKKSNKAAPPVKVLLRSRFNLFIRRDTVNQCSPYGSWLGAAILLPLIEAAGRLTPKGINRGYRRRWQGFIDREFSAYFAQSNRRVQEMTGLDLESMGYEVAEAV